MADKSAIEWTDATWNPIVGCSILTPGCTHCYAMGMAARIEAMTAALQATGGTGAPHYNGTTRKLNGKAVWTGKLALAPDHVLMQPLTWRTPRRIFVNSMGDLFHEDVPDEWIDKVFAIMALAPQHTFQVLTKRAKRMREYLTGSQLEHRIVAAQTQLNFCIPQHYRWPHTPLPNVWLGVSAERQQEADARVPSLLFTPAAIRFVSAEPLLSEINFRRISLGTSDAEFFADPSITEVELTLDSLAGAPMSGIPGLDMIIAGGESGPKARPMDPRAPRRIRDDCAATGKAFFFKQWGAWAPGNWAFDLDDRLYFFPDDERVPVRGLSDHQRAQARMIWSEGNKSPEGRGFLNLGKKAAGRLLDGVEHNAMPEAR